MSECSAYVFLQKFYIFWSYIQIFNSFCVHFCVWCQKVFQFHSLTNGRSGLPASLVKETVFSPLYILASFVKDKVSIGAWLYLWAFYFVPLIYISVFVPVSYCLDDCGFVVEPEVRLVDSSSSILLSQDCFGYSRFFIFPYKL